MTPKFDCEGGTWEWGCACWRLSEERSKSTCVFGAVLGPATGTIDTHPSEGLEATQEQKIYLHSGTVSQVLVA